jgi:hypothetical protein
MAVLSGLKDAASERRKCIGAIFLFSPAAKGALILFNKFKIMYFNERTSKRVDLIL